MTELSDILIESKNGGFLNELLKISNPNFFNMTKAEYVPQWMLDSLIVLTNLYDKGYEDAFNDLQSGR